MIKEWIARGVIILGLVLVGITPVIYQKYNNQGTLVHAHMAEEGGWTPENLTARVGEPLHLRLTSDDVTHGFAVGQLDQAAVDIIPGEVTEVTLMFTKPGKYTYYCTRWCSVNHWRMRGTIEVTGGEEIATKAQSPLYVKLGLDIDQAHQAGIIPNQLPSAWIGASREQQIQEKYKSRDYYLSHTPEELWQSLRGQENLNNLTDQEVWNLVAWVWGSNTNSAEVRRGGQLFADNCAACHGVSGAGDGVFADQVAAESGEINSNESMGGQTKKPANFSDPVRMLSASPALLQGKIIRGGMGTGMPSWGAIFTDEQTWALVAYIWSLQFQLEANP